MDPEFPKEAVRQAPRNHKVTSQVPGIRDFGRWPVLLHRFLGIPVYRSCMERREISRKPVLMSGAIQFAGSTINCLVRNMSISGAALDVTNPHDIPERFSLVFKADGTHIPCHVIWRQEERIGVAFD